MDKSEVLLKSTYDYSRKEKKIGGYKDPTELDRLRRLEIRKLGAWRKLMDVLDFVSDYGQKELLDAFERNLGSDPAKSGFDGELAEIIIHDIKHTLAVYNKNTSPVLNQILQVQAEGCGNRGSS